LIAILLYNGRIKIGH